MRCPKCGYISFDHQEICKKCAKNIGDTVAEVNGTVYEALAPVFLNLGAQSGFSGGGSSAEGSAPQGWAVAEHGEALAMGEEGGITFVDDDEIILADEDEEVIMDLDGFTEVSPREEFTLELGADDGGGEIKPPSLDFGDLDISDLAPPAKESVEPRAAVGLTLAEELQLSRAEPIAELSEIEPEPVAAPAPQPTGLEDLYIDGLDLDSPAPSVAGDVSGKRYIPSVKTGTALDSFDIDLGDLFAENKNVN